MTCYSSTRSSPDPVKLIYAQELKSIIKSIDSYPPTHKLLEAVMSKVTPLCVVIGQTPFLASWTPETNTITLDKKLSGPDQQITFLLFELLNALSEEEFEKLRKVDINKSSYVEGVEKLEHDNLLKLDELLNAAIADGLITKKVIRVIKDFPAFYRHQQLTGHAKKIGERYDRLYPEKHEPYKETWETLPSDPSHLSALLQLLILKNLASDSEITNERTRYRDLLQQSLVNIKTALSSSHKTEDEEKFLQALNELQLEELLQQP